MRVRACPSGGISKMSHSEAACAAPGQPDVAHTGMIGFIASKGIEPPLRMRCTLLAPNAVLARTQWSEEVGWVRHW